jgi:cobalt-zinc-cadmium resistance protein CzcA
VSIYKRLSSSPNTLRPFAIVIVGDLLANLVIGVFLLPTLYVWVARADDILPASESAEDL